MSAPAIVRNALASAAAVTAEVPAARIFVGDIPLKAALPAIGAKFISGTERQTVKMGEASRYRVDRVQVTVYAATYQAKVEILELVRTALCPKRGAVGGFAVDSIMPDGEGPDLDEGDPMIYERSRDFVVSWLT